MSMPLEKPGKIALPALYLAWAWGMLTLGAMAVLVGDAVLPGGIRLGVSRTILHAVSAATLTGFPVSLGLDEFRIAGRVYVLVVTAVATWLMLVLAGLPMKRLVGLDCRDRTVAGVALLMVVLAAVVGVLVHQQAGGAVPGLLAGVGALGGSGATMWVPGINSLWLQGLLVPLFVFGALGPVVVIDLWRKLTRRGHELGEFANWTLAASAGWMLVAVAVVTVLHSAELPRGLALAASMTGYGLPVEYAGGWSRSGQIAAVFVMLGGLCLGGAGSGVGAVSLFVIARGVAAGMRGRSVPRLFHAALLHLAAVAGLLLLTWMALLATDPQLASERLLLLSAAAVSNTGIAPDPINIVGPGLFVLAGAMVAGRAMSLGALYLYARVYTGRRTGE
jgi:hypothetical protein